MKRFLSLLLALALLTGLCPAVCFAGDPTNYIYLTSADGASIPVYKKASAKSKVIGSLVPGQDGFYDWDQQKDGSGWILLESPVKGYVRAEQVKEVEYGETPEAPAVVALAKDGARLREGTGSKAATLCRLPEGLKLLIRGEFGAMWLAEALGSMELGYIAKKVVTLTEERLDLNQQPGSDRMEVFAAEGLTFAPGYTGTDKNSCVTVPAGERPVYQFMSDWALVSGSWQACLVEPRFLDPEGDHSLPVKYVATTADSSRLLVRYEPVKDEEYEAKLFSGAAVTPLAVKGEWTQIAVVDWTGWVQTKYLADQPKADLRVQATLDSDFQTAYRPASFLEAGAKLTLIGSQDHLMIALTEDGQRRLIPIDLLTRTDGGSLTAKATGNVKLREKADQQSAELYTIKKGASMTVLIQGDVWSQVRFNGQTGYVMTRYLKF